MRRLLVPALAALILATPAQAGLSRSERAEINRTIDAFVRDGVRHENLAAAYDLTTPTFRGGVSRAQWAKGDTPIYPYPARGTSWHGWTLDYALRNDVAFELFLQPRAGAKVDPTSFSGEVKKIHGRWLVDSFYAAATFSTKTQRVVGPRDFGPGTGASGDGGNSTLGAIWFLAPASVGALILLVPLSFLGLSIVRGRRRRPSLEERERYEEFAQRLRSRASVRG
jgi:hypothetical protein